MNEKKVIHTDCGTQIGWHTGFGKKGFANMDGEPRKPGDQYICPNCGKIEPNKTKLVL